MRLNSFNIESTVNTVKLLESIRNHDLYTAKVYLGGFGESAINCVASGKVTFYESDGNLIASVKSQFALSESTPISRVIIKVYDSDEEEIMSSYTEVNDIIDVGDTNFRVFVKVMGTWPFNERKFIIPESKADFTGENGIARKSLSDFPAQV